MPSTGPSSRPRNGRSPRSGARAARGRGTGSTPGSSTAWSGKGSRRRPRPTASRSCGASSLDLRGLPPTPREIEAFADDPSPDAYERAVDRFLADPAYGERWARMWLDLARYADSAGFGSDPLRPNIWRYRDWVIDAFNRNLPYDRFTVEQIAGDLLPEPTLEARMATAFHRNTMTNTEGGTDDEEFRVAAIKDRADTTAQVWMGLTMGCAKCHTHKYDPITHEEYYRFYAFFNQTADADRPDETPVIPAPTPAQRGAEPAHRRPGRRAEGTARRHHARARRRPGALGGRAGQASGMGHPRARLDPLRVGCDLREPAGRLDPGRRPQPRPRDLHDRRADEPPGADGHPPGGHPRPDAPRRGIGPGGGRQLRPLAVRASRSTPARDEAVAPTARYVRVELPGEGKILSLAEVQVFPGARMSPGPARPSSRAPTTTARPRGRSTATPTALLRRELDHAHQARGQPLVAGEAGRGPADRPDRRLEPHR